MLESLSYARPPAMPPFLGMASHKNVAYRASPRFPIDGWGASMNGPTGNLSKSTRPNLVRLLGLLAIPVLLVVFTMVLGRGSMLDASPKTRVFKFKDGVWSSTDALPGAAGDIRISPRGVVW